MFCQFFCVSVYYVYSHNHLLFFDPYLEWCFLCPGFATCKVTKMSVGGRVRALQHLMNSSLSSLARLDAHVSNTWWWRLAAYEFPSEDCCLWLLSHGRFLRWERTHVSYILHVTILYTMYRKVLRADRRIPGQCWIIKSCMMGAYGVGVGTNGELQPGSVP